MGIAIANRKSQIAKIAAISVRYDQFFAPFFKEIPSFFCGVTPSETLAAAQPLNIAFPLGNGGVLRSEEGEGFRKEGDGGEGEKKGKKDAQKVLSKGVPSIKI